MSTFNNEQGVKKAKRVAETLNTSRTKGKFIKKAIVGIMALIAVVLAILGGMLYGVVEASKETRAGKDGTLTTAAGNALSVNVATSTSVSSVDGASKSQRRRRRLAQQQGRQVAENARTLATGATAKRALDTVGIGDTVAQSCGDQGSTVCMSDAIENLEPRALSRPCYHTATRSHTQVYTLHSASPPRVEAVNSDAIAAAVAGMQLYLRPSPLTCCVTSTPHSSPPLARSVAPHPTPAPPLSTLLPPYFFCHQTFRHCISRQRGKCANVKPTTRM